MQLRDRIDEIESEIASADTGRALTALMDDLRRLAGRYEPARPVADLVASTRAAMSEVVDGVVLHHGATPDVRVEGSVLLRRGDLTIELIAREVGGAVTTTRV